MESIFDLFINEDAYRGLDEAGAVERLSRALRFETRSETPAPGADPMAQTAKGARR